MIKFGLIRQDRFPELGGQAALLAPRTPELQSGRRDFGLRKSLQSNAEWSGSESRQQIGQTESR